MHVTKRKAKNTFFSQVDKNNRERGREREERESEEERKKQQK